jgi:hypothetical protein
MGAAIAITTTANVPARMLKVTSVPADGGGGRAVKKIPQRHDRM